jgi:tetratricopeptide (TPR) repeat protein
MGEFTRSAAFLAEIVARFRALGDRRSLAQALVNRALTSLYLGEAEPARRQAEDAIAVSETVDDPWLCGLAWFGLGEIVIASDPDAARSAYERGLAVWRAVGDPWGIALALSGLGGLAMHRRDYGSARGLMEEALALRRTVNNAPAIALSLVSLGELARREGDATRALPLLSDGLSRFRASGDEEHVAWTLFNLGRVAVASADWPAASGAFAECLDVRRQQGNADKIAETIAWSAVIVAAAEPLLAARLVGSVAAARVPGPDDEGDGDAPSLALARAGLDNAVLAAELAAGRALGLIDAARLAADALRRFGHRP